MRISGSCHASPSPALRRPVLSPPLSPSPSLPHLCLDRPLRARTCARSPVHPTHPSALFPVPIFLSFSLYPSLASPLCIFPPSLGPQPVLAFTLVHHPVLAVQAQAQAMNKAVVFDFASGHRTAAQVRRPRRGDSRPAGLDHPAARCAGATPRRAPHRRAPHHTPRPLVGLRVNPSCPAAPPKWNPGFFHFGAVGLFGHWGAERRSSSLLPTGPRSLRGGDPGPRSRFECPGSGWGAGETPVSFERLGGRGAGYPAPDH